MILILVGTKAQLIKMAPVMLEFQKQEISFDFVLTGQHQETIEDLINDFSLPKPSYSLTGLEEASTATKLSKWLLTLFLKHFRSSSPLATRGYKLCLVHGDTLSTLAGAILAKRHGITLAHVEAGLRSNNIFHPFPEEITRIAVSKISNIFYYSGNVARCNIEKIKTNADSVDLGENTLLDSVRIATKLNRNTSENQRYCVVSIHRFENISKKSTLKFIVDQISEISQSIRVKFVLHAATKKSLEKHKLMERINNNSAIEIQNRMAYTDFISLLRNSSFLITDGGSNQEECSYLNVPCLLLRQKTERFEGLDKNIVLSEYKVEVIKNFVAEHMLGDENKHNLEHYFLTEPSKNLALDVKYRLKGITKP